MPYLVCSASTCVYNKGQCCSKGDITAGGREAETSRETCCESFRERTGGQAVSSMGIPSQTVQVDCEACHCHYNNDCKCTAERVGISGAGACTCDQTECGTFQCCHK